MWRENIYLIFLHQRFSSAALEPILGRIFFQTIYPFIIYNILFPSIYFTLLILRYQDIVKYYYINVFPSTLNTTKIAFKEKQNKNHPQIHPNHPKIIPDNIMLYFLLVFFFWGVDLFFNLDLWILFGYFNILCMLCLVASVCVAYTLLHFFTWDFSNQI